MNHECINYEIGSINEMTRGVTIRRKNPAGLQQLSQNFMSPDIVSGPGVLARNR
jgi:hypothetical protein